MADAVVLEQVTEGVGAVAVVGRDPLDWCAAAGVVGDQLLGERDAARAAFAWSQLDYRVAGVIVDRDMGV